MNHVTIAISCQNNYKIIIFTMSGGPVPHQTGGGSSRLSAVWHIRHCRITSKMSKAAANSYFHCRLFSWLIFWSITHQMDQRWKNFHHKFCPHSNVTANWGAGTSEYFPFLLNWFPKIIVISFSVHWLMDYMTNSVSHHWSKGSCPNIATIHAAIWETGCFIWHQMNILSIRWLEESLKDPEDTDFLKDIYFSKKIWIAKSSLYVVPVRLYIYICSFCKYDLTHSNKLWILTVHHKHPVKAC